MERGHMKIILFILIAAYPLTMMPVAAIHLSPLEERFMQAAKNNNIQELQDAVRNHVYVLARDDNGFTALHWAAQTGSKEAVLFLINNGANVEDAQNKEHITPAQLAHRMHHTDIEALLSKAADEQATRRKTIIPSVTRSMGSIKTNPRSEMH